MKIMIFDEAVAWTTANRPHVAQALLKDMQPLRAGRGPTPEQLKGAPTLDHWMPVIARNLVYLSGRVEGHPLLRDGLIVTSYLCAIDSGGFTWARTGSRYYILGGRFSGFEIVGRGQ